MQAILWDKLPIAEIVNVQGDQPRAGRRKATNPFDAGGRQQIRHHPHGQLARRHKTSLAVPRAPR